MMDFLRALAPAHDGDATRAVAALPSRFAAGHPLRAVGFDTQTPVIEEEAHQVTGEPAIPVSAPSVAPAASRTRRGDPNGPSAIAHSAEETPDTILPVAPSVLLAHRGSHLKSPVTSTPIEPPADEHDEHCGTRTSLEADAVHVPVSPGETWPTRGAGARWPASSQPATQPTVHPLSAAALATRTPNVTSERPVIHVTIDRIDVRVAARPRVHSPQPVTPHAPSPHVSLVEYLRPRVPGK